MLKIKRYVEEPKGTYEECYIPCEKFAQNPFLLPHNSLRDQ